jgi:hypothetical protein
MMHGELVKEVEMKVGKVGISTADGAQAARCI